MKRILFCAGVLALAASCTESELDTISVQEGSKNGITFQAVEGGENASTRGGWTPGANNTYVPIWHAETDKIAVYATGVMQGAVADVWADFDDTKAATYKATKSAGAGQFTGTEDGQILKFAATVTEKAPAKFFAVYPSALPSAAADDVKFETALAVDKFTVKIGKIALTAQSQSDITGGGVYDKFVKWSATTAFPTKAWDAVGEKIALDFQRPLSGLVFSIKNAEKYTKGDNSIFGKLKSIKLTSDGNKATGAVATTKDILTLGANALLEVNVTDITKPEAKLIPGSAAGLSDITLTLGGNDGLEWSDEAKAYMVIAPVKRTEEKFLTVVYKFENIEITVQEKTANSWIAGGFQEFPALDLNNKDFDYLATGVGSTPNTLVINKGSLASIMTEDGLSVKWGATPVLATAFTTIVCDAVLTDADLKLLANFTNLENVTLNKNTSIPAKTFTVGNKLKSIDMPEVTAIDKEAFVALTLLESLKLKSYQFNDEKVNALFFNNNTQAKLETLDMSSVANLSTPFNSNVVLTFKSYSALTTVTLKNEAQLSESAFDDCENLESVIGAVKLAPSAFKGCVLLDSVNIVGTVIPAEAFSGCTLLAKVGKDQVAPTEVGKEAFMGTAIQYMDMSKITKLGVSAFQGATALEGTSKTEELLTVPADFIPADAFNGAVKITKVDFTNATSFDEGIFEGCTSLNQVRFHKAFTIKTNPDWASTFGPSTSTKVRLYVAAGQKYYVGNNLTLPTVDKTATVSADTEVFTFLGIAIND